VRVGGTSPARDDERLRLAALTVAFVDPALEREFRERVVAASRGAWRRAYRNILFVWLGFCFWDALVIPSASHTLWLLRLVFAGPPLVAAIAVGFAAPATFVRASQPIGAAAFAIPTVAAALVSAWIPAVAPWAPYALVLTTMFAHAAAMLRFVYASAVGWLVFVAYVVCALVAARPRAEVVNAVIWLATANLIGMLVSRSFERFRRRDFFRQRLLERERAKSERLVVNMLPERIAARLKAGEQPIADRLDDVTVLFADLVRFTVMADRLPPERVVALLDQLFSTFDELSARHGLEKIKTMGDAYMVVGGAPEPRADHTRAIAELAFDLRAAVAELSRSGALPGVELRLGMHCGPAVAGVIGHQKLSYDIWGDTVNVASRMESQGVVGAIQVSEPVYQRLRGEFVFESRGQIEIKGKGPVTTYLLLGRKTK